MEKVTGLLDIRFGIRHAAFLYLSAGSEHVEVLVSCGPTACSRSLPHYAGSGQGADCNSDRIVRRAEAHGYRLALGTGIPVRHGRAMARPRGPLRRRLGPAL
jgi:hypothetical protein